MAIVNAIVNINNRTITGTATIMPVNKRYLQRRTSTYSASWHHRQHGSHIIAVVVADTINAAIANNNIRISNASCITKATAVIIVVRIFGTIIATAANSQ